MCVSLGLRMAPVTSRTNRSCASYIGALLASVSASISSFFSLHATLPFLGFVPQRLCASALLSARLFALLLFELYFSGSALPYVSASPLVRSPLILHSSLLCIRSSSATLNYYSTSAIIHNFDCGTHTRHTFAGEIKISLI